MAEGPVALHSLNRQRVLTYTPQQVAQMFREKSGQSGPPLDFEAVLPHLGSVRVVELDLVGDGYSLEFGDGSGEILVSKRAMRNYRWRFTVAHEIAHWITHRYIRNAREHEHRQAKYEEVENWCDEFASEFLVPKGWLRKYLGGLQNLGRPGVLAEGPKTFQVSRAVFERRLFEAFRIISVRLDQDGGLDIPPIAESFRGAVQDVIAARTPAQSDANWVGTATVGRRPYTIVAGRHHADITNAEGK